MRLIALAMAVIAAPAAKADFLYVDHTATGSGDGSSWADAFVSIESAMADGDVVPDDTLQAAQGTYETEGSAIMTRTRLGSP